MRLGAVLGERERERVKNLSLFKDRKGVPIGNLTSQLFANVYMNEFDQFIKQELKVKYYARYTDDFIIVSRNIKYLESLIGPINVFLNQKLKLNLHPEKVSILKYVRGIDFLGYVIFPYHKLIRKRTWKRILRSLENKISMYKNGLVSKENLDQTLQSYLGILSHGNNHNLSEYLKNQYWFWLNG
jgi:RNA-directed DNA polymerase